ncbi:MAG: hypothetical protein ACKVOM_02725 [Ferruginibacter sp.]
MFNALYEFTLGSGFQYVNEFVSDQILNTAGLVTLLVSLGLAAVYYLLLNRLTDKFDQIIHWFIVMDLSLVFAGLFAWWVGHKELVETIGDDTVSVPVLFWVMNIIYAAVYYMLGSLAFRKLSKYATKIPF